jgi:hypothetical protein
MRDLRVSGLHLVAFVAGLGLLAITQPASGQTSGEDGSFRWEVVLTGKLTDVRIGQGRVVRTRCITAFEEIMADPEYRARLPEEAVKVEHPVDVAWNPNNLKYQSEEYLFIHSDYFEILVQCNLEDQGASGIRSTLVVEATPFGAFQGGDLEDVVRSHMAWIRSRLSSIVD